MAAPSSIRSVSRSRGRNRARALWLHDRTCPGCGYSGPELQLRDEQQVFECPLCGEDLYAHPALSYAEREGLCEDPPLDGPDLWTLGAREATLRDRVGAAPGPRRAHGAHWASTLAGGVMRRLSRRLSRFFRVDTRR